MKFRKPTSDFSAPLASQFEQLPGFAELLARVNTYSELGKRLTDLVPLSLRAKVRFTSVDGNKLRFLAESSAWATKLRLLSDRLIAEANGLGYQQITALVVQVRRIDGFP